MKVTFAVCADRAVGFGAAFVGLALLLLTVRHLFAPIAPIAPIATYESPSAFVARAPVVAAHAVVAHAVRRAAVSPRSRPAAPVLAHAAVPVARAYVPRVAQRPAPRAIAHASARTQSVGMRSRAVVRSREPVRGPVRATRSVAYGRGASVPARFASSHVDRARIASARVATSPVAPTHVASTGDRRSEGSRSRTPSIVPSKRRPRVRPTAPAAFRMPARFDVRPALVTVPDAAVAALPTDDALPTIDARKRRR